jgi:uncharacterized protein
MRKLAMKIALLFVALYVVPVILIGCIQRKFIYFPSRVSDETALEMAQRHGFQAWTRDGQVIGWRMAAAGATGSVLIVHGNAGSAAGRAYFAVPIRAAAPLDVFVLEYPGYGARGGEPSMKNFLRAAEEAFVELPTNGPVYLVAESLGTGVAAHLAKVFPNRVKGVVFFAPYNDLADVGQRQMPYVPVKLLMRDRFRPAEWLKDYAGPIHVVLAERDTIIPVRYGQKLFDSYAGPKSIEVIQGAGHNDVAVQSPEWWREVFRSFANPTSPTNSAR